MRSMNGRRGVDQSGTIPIEKPPWRSRGSRHELLHAKTYIRFQEIASEVVGRSAESRSRGDGEIEDTRLTSSSTPSEGNSEGTKDSHRFFAVLVNQKSYVVETRSRTAQEICWTSQCRHLHICRGPNHLWLRGSRSSSEYACADLV